MGEMFVLRRADGGFFSKELHGKLTLPVWSSEESLARYQERNPTLMTFMATPLTRSLISKIENEIAGERITGFFLPDEDDPNADLGDGRPISLEEIFSKGESTLRPAQLQL
jgi:hypothetical protein